MNDILENEIKRQEYMEMRYKVIDEEQYKPDVDEISGEKKDGNNQEEPKEENELKYLEDGFLIEKAKLLAELGILVPNQLQPPDST